MVSVEGLICAMPATLSAIVETTGWRSPATNDKSAMCSRGISRNTYSSVQRKVETTCCGAAMGELMDKNSSAQAIWKRAKRRAQLLRVAEIITMYDLHSGDSSCALFWPPLLSSPFHLRRGWPQRQPKF